MLWERFTERAKHVVSAAREEATRLGSEYVRTEHILLGLCRSPKASPRGAGKSRRGHRPLAAEIEAAGAAGQCGGVER
jgi:ATP-dependent Clp protease ATP-binding subunit ClpA